MKDTGKILLFFLSTLLRSIAFPIFILMHLFWGVYSFEIDPIQLLDLSTVPSVVGVFGWLYFSLSAVILVFMTLGFKFLGYSVFLAALFGQTRYFLQRWDYLIYETGGPASLGDWFGLIFLGLLIGFILQVAYTGGTKYYKISRYDRLRQQDRGTKDA